MQNQEPQGRTSTSAPDGTTELGAIRSFTTGATRSADSHRDDPEGFLSPLVLDRFNQYMSKHRKQADGSLRDSDNWQKGIPLKAYMKGLWRHFLHLWTRHRGWPVTDPGAAVDIEEDCCSIMFNVMGYLHETIKERIETEEKFRRAGRAGITITVTTPDPEQVKRALQTIDPLTKRRAEGEGYDDAVKRPEYVHSSPNIWRGAEATDVDTSAPVDPRRNAQPIGSMDAADCDRTQRAAREGKDAALSAYRRQYGTGA